VDYWLNKYYKTTKPAYRFPLALPRNRARLGLKLGVGIIFMVLLPQKATLILNGEGYNSGSIIDRCILAVLVYKGRKNPDIINQLNYLFIQHWSSDEVLSWYADTDNYLLDVFIPHNLPLIKKLEEEIISNQKLNSLCEIGTGNGKVLEYLKERFTIHGVHNFIGLDLNGEQSQKNSIQYANKDLHFVGCNAVTWIPLNAKPGWIFFTNGGVLEYFTPILITSLLSTIKTRFPPSLFAIIEPMGKDFNLKKDFISYPYGSESSWSHNYPHLFQTNGFTIEYQNEITTNSQRFIQLIASNRN
jgi:hypothetical protein